MRKLSVSALASRDDPFRHLPAQCLALKFDAAQVRDHFFRTLSDRSE